MSFDELQLATPLLRAIRSEGYQSPTPIQSKAIPGILAGRDLLGIAQTGTGKTAAFAVPVLQNLLRERNTREPRRIRVLAVTPTRELAAQVGESFAKYGKFTGLRHTTIYGGVGQFPQVRALNRGVDILVATPGRLLDLINQGHVRLGQVKVLILDEADRMFDMGFLPDIRKIVGYVPEERQTLLFSATMPPDIRHLADDLLKEPIRVSIAPAATPAEHVKHSLYYVEKPDKIGLLLHLLDTHAMPRVLVFTRTRHGADGVTRKLSRENVLVETIHGGKSQGQRTRVLDQFRKGRLQMLVATDIAARGLDIDNVTHVVNFDLPNESENYIHRIGRTARAGKSGEAVAFCAREEYGFLRGIEGLMRLRLEEVKDHPFRSTLIPLSPPSRPAAPSPFRRGPRHPAGPRRSGMGKMRPGRAR